MFKTTVNVESGKIVLVTQEGRIKTNLTVKQMLALGIGQDTPIFVGHRSAQSPDTVGIEYQNGGNREEVFINREMLVAMVDKKKKPNKPTVGNKMNTGDHTLDNMHLLE